MPLRMHAAAVMRRIAAAAGRTVAAVVMRSVVAASMLRVRTIEGALTFRIAPACIAATRGFIATR